MFKFNCLNCNKEVTANTKYQLKRKGKYCCFKCYLEYIHTHKHGEFRICEKCGKEFWGNSWEIRRGAVRFCSRKCSGFLRKDRKMSTDGYWIVYTPDGFVKEQRWIMQQHIGRKLGRDEIVHHINGDKLDNRIENLEIVTRGRHNTIHATGNRYRHNYFLRLKSDKTT